MGNAVDEREKQIRAVGPRIEDGAMTFEHHETLDYSKLDSVGYRPVVTMIDQQYFHPKTQRLYTVNGFVWDSDLDQWKVTYWRVGCITHFCRLPDQFALKFVLLKNPASPFPRPPTHGSAGFRSDPNATVMNHSDIDTRTTAERAAIAVGK